MNQLPLNSNLLTHSRNYKIKKDFGNIRSLTRFTKNVLEKAKLSIKPNVRTEWMSLVSKLQIDFFLLFRPHTVMLNRPLSSAT